LLLSQRSWKKNHWNTICISLFIYFVGFKLLQIYFNLFKIEGIISLLYRGLFAAPFVMDYVITISSCFFLQNMYARFQTLNDFWKCLPVDLVSVPAQWTHTEIVAFMEDTRMLHSELCDLLKMFTQGYGPLLLGFFTYSFMNMLICVYFIVNGDVFNSIHSSKNAWKHFMSLIVHFQVVIFLMSIIIFVSFINEQVTQEYQV